MRQLLSVLDHLVYATPDLEAAVGDIEALFGVRAAIGGQHPAWGTKNALITLGPRMYLEIMGPDPNQPKPSDPRPFDLDELAAPRLVTWVARGQDLQAIVAAANRDGLDLGNVQERSRQRPDGSQLRWTMTDLRRDREDGLILYFINWGNSPHPAEGSSSGCVLLGLKAIHPDAERVGRLLLNLELDLVVESGAAAMLVATIETPKGRFDLK